MATIFITKYNPAQPGYNPAQPGYNPAQPEYNPAQPGYNPASYRRYSKPQKGLSYCFKFLHGPQKKNKKKLCKTKI